MEPTEDELFCSPLFSLRFHWAGTDLCVGLKSQGPRPGSTSLSSTVPSEGTPVGVGRCETSSFFETTDSSCNKFLRTCEDSGKTLVPLSPNSLRNGSDPTVNPYRGPNSRRHKYLSRGLHPHTTDTHTRTRTHTYIHPLATPFCRVNSCAKIHVTVESQTPGHLQHRQPKRERDKGSRWSRVTETREVSKKSHPVRGRPY